MQFENILAITISLVGLVISVTCACYCRRQTQATERQAEAAEQQVELMVEQTDAAERQAEIMLQQIEMAEAEAVERQIKAAEKPPNEPHNVYTAKLDAIQKAIEKIANEIRNK